MTELTDTHCHIHNAGRVLPGEDPTADIWLKAGMTDSDQLVALAAERGVTRLVCVGTDAADSRLAVEFASERNMCWATIGIHPHEAKKYAQRLDKLQNFCNLTVEEKVIGIGECGLDYYYNHSAKEDQMKVLRFQIELALQHDLPMVFHVREAFDDFWSILKGYKGVKGVIHSFTAGPTQLKRVLEHDLFVGLNGIITFTKDKEQLEAAKRIPANRLLLETDAPYLTPVPFRGTICEPMHVRVTAEFLANLRGEDLDTLVAATTQNARQLFKI